MNWTGDLLSGSIFAKLGSIWFVRFAGRDSLHSHWLGFLYIRELLRHPGVAIPPLELVIAVRGMPAELSASQQRNLVRQGAPVGRVMDHRYVHECRHRLSEIEAELAEAAAENDLGRIEALQNEKGHIESILEKGLGPGNRPHRERTAADNARSSVQRAISRASCDVGAQNELLERHFANSIHTGTVCVYQPDELLEITWMTELPVASPSVPLLNLFQTR